GDGATRDVNVHRHDVRVDAGGATFGSHGIYVIREAVVSGAGPWGVGERSVGGQCERATGRRRIEDGLEGGIVGHTVVIVNIRIVLQHAVGGQDNERCLYRTW